MRFLRLWMSRRIAWMDGRLTSERVEVRVDLVGERERLVDGGKCGFGIAITCSPAACAERMPASESSIAAAFDTPSRRTTSS